MCFFVFGCACVDFFGGGDDLAFLRLLAVVFWNDGNDFVVMVKMFIEYVLQCCIVVAV